MSLVNLSEHILKGQVFALNNLKHTDPQNVFQGGSTLVCRSDADNQLILFVPFSQTVRLSAFSINGPKGNEQPVLVKLFVNRPALGFEDVADVEPAQTCVITDTDLEKELKLKVVKFGAVNSLHLFIEGPEGSDHVTVNSLAFFGQVTQGVADYSKLKHSHGEE
jgi:hypothetical protein